MQIEAHLAATNRMAPAMLQIPGSARYLPMTALVVFTGTRFLTTFPPQDASSPARGPGSESAAKRIRSAAAPEDSALDCNDGPADGGNGVVHPSKSESEKQLALAQVTAPIEDLADAGAESLAAVIAGDAPAKISAAQVLELIAAAQYFLAEDLLEPLGDYAEPVIAALNTPVVRRCSCLWLCSCVGGKRGWTASMPPGNPRASPRGRKHAGCLQGGELLHAAAAAIGAGSRTQAHQLLLRLFKYWWRRFEDTPSSSGPAAPTLADVRAALRALITGCAENTSLQSPTPLPQPFYSATCCEAGLPRGLGLLFAVMAAFGCDCQSSEAADSAVQCAFAADSLSKFVSCNALYHLRAREDVRTALVDVLVLVVAQRHTRCPCAVDLLRTVAELSVSRLPPPRGFKASSTRTAQAIEVDQGSARVALLLRTPFVAPPASHSCTSGKVTVEFKFSQGSSPDRTEAGAQLFVDGSEPSGKKAMTAHLAVLPSTAEAAEAFEVTAQQWCASQAKFTSLEAASGYVGRLDGEWEGAGLGWQNLAERSSDFWSGLGYRQALGEKFVCALLCAAKDFELT